MGFSKQSGNSSSSNQKATTSNSSSNSSNNNQTALSSLLGSGFDTSSNVSVGMSADPVSAIVGSVSGVVQAFVNADSKKEVARLQVEAEQLQVEAEDAKADQELYKVLQEKVKTKQQQLQTASDKAKQTATNNMLIFLGVLVFALGIIFVVFKYLFGSKPKQAITPKPATNNVQTIQAN